MSFNYFVSEAVFRYVVEAVTLVAEEGWRLMPDYRFDATTGLWHHRDGAVEPPLRLDQVTYDASGAMTYPHTHTTADESILEQHLADARTLFASRAADIENATHEELSDLLGADVEALRWFDLPLVCLDR